MPSSGELPVFGQLYFLDTSKARGLSSQHSANIHLNQELLGFLDQIIRNVSTYAQVYKLIPKDLEYYCLCLLLLYVPGAQCFDDLKTVNNKPCDSFYEAAHKHELLENDNEWTRSSNEAIQ
ncbi:2807_t:CDS:2 [Gigaspora margarita]|uniref:2807_t:CDS:1 n=1 Tax=Gigaspora margarita TaxID=4874 RepID=A0ABN7V1E3_GIGMA|nr:2807_t:CDS:2 [Gigaspora margarita]